MVMPMAVAAIDVRYSTEMNRLFDEEARLVKWLQVEGALAWAQGQLGLIPPEAAREIVRKASTRFVKLERVKEIEKKIDHDLMAAVRALADACRGNAGGYVHLGATSYDIEDTATALTFIDALGLIEKRVRRLRDLLARLALKHKRTVCIGRTHGQHAVPTTYGMKFALWASELDRHLLRLGQARERIAVGKMSGAVGTMATFGPRAFELQQLVMKRLGLKPAPITNQIVQRDRHAEVLFVLALIACTLDKMGREIRNLQRTEIMELAEPMKKGQVGSSTMPQKRNPHRSERICSLARVLRSHLSVALENIPLEHERDLTNSASERVVFAEAFILADYMLKEMLEIIDGLDMFPDNIERNLTLNRGLVMAERLMVALANKGMSRQDAHELLRRASARAFRAKKHLREELLEDRDVRRYLTKGDLEEIFDEHTYIGKAPEIVERAVKGMRA